MGVKLVAKPSGTESVPVTPRAFPFQDNIPGPGSYNVTHQSPVFNSVSLSTRGTCAFPSRVRAPSLGHEHSLIRHFLHSLHNHVLDIRSLLSKGPWF